MKIKVLDLCYGEPQVNEWEEQEFFEDYYGGSWSKYIEAFNAGNLDEYNLNLDDVDTSVFIIDDGGEAIRLKDGRFLNVCWWSDTCRVWTADEDDIEYWMSKFKAYETKETNSNNVNEEIDDNDESVDDIITYDLYDVEVVDIYGDVVVFTDTFDDEDEAEELYNKIKPSAGAVINLRKLCYSKPNHTGYLKTVVIKTSRKK